MSRQRKQHTRTGKYKEVKESRDSRVTAASDDKHEESVIPLAVACGIISLCLYANTLFHKFTLDDNSAIEKNWVLEGSAPWSAMITTDIWGGDLTSSSSHYSWRPLMVLTLRINYALSGLNPLPYHLFNIILNSITCAMLVVWLLPTLPSKPAPFPYPWLLTPRTIFSITIALVFTCHPVHVESVANSQNRAEPLCAFFSFWAFNMHSSFMKKSKVDYDKLGRLVLLIWCATLCKELGITLTVICAVHDISYNILPLWFGNKKLTKQTKKFKDACLVRVTLLALCAFSYLGLRKVWFYQNSPNPSFEDNPLLFCEPMTRFRTALYLQWRYVGLLISPTHLSSDYSYNAIPLVETWTDPRLLLVLGLIIVLVCIVYRAWMDAVFNDDRRLVLGLAWLYLPLLPASHIVVVGTVIAERLLFTPVVGYAIILAYFLEKLVTVEDKSIEERKLRRPGEKPKVIAHKTMREKSVFLTNIVRMGLYLVLILFSIRTITRNMAWYNPDSLATSLYSTYPASVKACEGMASLHHRAEEWDPCLERLREALSIRPQNSRAYTTMTKVYRFSEKYRNYTKALEFATKCLEFSKNKANIAECHYQKGGIYLKLENLEESLKELAQSELFQKSNAKAACFHGDVFGKSGRFQEALEKYKKCELRAGGKLELSHALNYGQALLQSGQHKEGEAKLNAILPIAQKSNPQMAGFIESILADVEKAKKAGKFNNPKRRRKKKKN